MNLSDYVKKINELQNEIENIHLVNEKANYSLNCIESYEINETHDIEFYSANQYTTFYLDTDLLVNALEQQKEKNEARLNEIKQEFSKLQKEDIQLWLLNTFS